MKDFDSRWPNANEAALVAELEVAHSPPLPDNLRAMIVADLPLWKQIINTLLRERKNKSGRSPLGELPAEARDIAQRLRDDPLLMRACGLELCRQLAIANAEIEWKVAMLERMIGGNRLH
jgi:hypothetical protein